MTLRSSLATLLALALGLAVALPAFCACGVEAPEAMAGMPCHEAPDAGPKLARPCCCLQPAPDGPDQPAAALVSTASTPAPQLLAWADEASSAVEPGLRFVRQRSHASPLHPLPASSQPLPLRI